MSNKSYLPTDNFEQILDCLKSKQYSQIVTITEDLGDYDRFGWDRLLSILFDLRRIGFSPPGSVLDIGCNVGTFALGLGLEGYDVLGIENDRHSAVLGQDSDILASGIRIAERLGLSNVKFQFAEAMEFALKSDHSFDITLLLSVVHNMIVDVHRRTGSLDEITDMLRVLIAKTRHFVYFEGPEEEDPLFGMIPLPRWFLDQGLVRRIVPISVSPAADGRLRTLYRIEI